VAHAALPKTLPALAVGAVGVLAARHQPIDLAEMAATALLLLNFNGEANARSRY
jgi:hypothetical protein